MCSVTAKVSRGVKCLIKSTEESEQEIVNDGVDQEEVAKSSVRIVSSSGDSPTLGIREPIYEVIRSFYDLHLLYLSRIFVVLTFCT